MVKPFCDRVVRLHCSEEVCRYDFGPLDKQASNQINPSGAPMGKVQASNYLMQELIEGVLAICAGLPPDDGPRAKTLIMPMKMQTRKAFLLYPVE